MLAVVDAGMEVEMKVGMNVVVVVVLYVEELDVDKGDEVVMVVKMYDQRIDVWVEVDVMDNM